MNYDLRFRIWLLLISSLFFLKSSFLNPQSTDAASLESVSYTITVTASVGEPKLTLFGYSSPNSLVELKGNRVSEQVIANQAGYFFFDRIFLPRPTPNYPELCLISIDTQSRTSFPTCLPPLPIGPYEITVGPVLLPPTISLEKGRFLPGEQVIAEGLTIPNSEVAIYLANDSSTAYLASSLESDRSLMARLNKNLIPTVYAYSLPKYQIRADENGRFEFNLPATRPNHWRVFATASYLGSPTPKSNTLAFKVLNWWEWLWQKLREILSLILGFLRPYLWQLIILIEVIVIILLFKLKTQISNVKSQMSKPYRKS